MSPYLVPLITASATWLDRMYGCGEASPLLAAMGQVQARQAVSVAAMLRYPTVVDSALVHLTGPGGADRLEAALGLAGAQVRPPWHTWVDEAVVSWAACLLVDRGLARAAVRAVAGCEHLHGLPVCMRSLVEPDSQESRASMLLRHPSLVEPVARLHGAQLYERLGLPELSAWWASS